MIGDVVFAPFPYTRLRGRTLRPAVVLARSGLEEWNDWVVCQVTGTGRERPGAIHIASDDIVGQALSPESRVRPDRLFTLNESVFEFTFGRLTNAKLTEILTATRALFQPPSRP